MPSCRNICNSLAGFILEYQTPKIVTVRSSRIGLLNRFVQILILAYIIGYAIIWQKGYQETDTAQSSVVAKVKGIATTKHRDDLEEVYRRVWDTPDYVIPPQENGACFIMTNAIITPNQSQGICQEDTELGTCSSASECPEGQTSKNGNGVYTGHCKKSPINETVNTCEIEAWCPVEHDKLLYWFPNKPLLPQTFNFTILIKNSINFPKFKAASRRNILDKINNDTYLKNCHYNEKSDPFCPVFQVGYIVDQTKTNFTELAINGGIINIVIKWNCNLDFSIDYCTPTYEFARLDDAQVKISPGWNFRYTNNYQVNGTLTRDLIKAYGILFFFNVEGKAGKFNAVPLLLNIGAGLAILGVATIVCDIILLYCLKKREYYSGKKYLKVVDEDYNKFEDTNDSETVDTTHDLGSPFEQPQARR